MPMSASMPPCFITSQNTPPGVAPSARRVAISSRRCAHRVRDDAVDADRGQQHGDGAEDQHQRHAELLAGGSWRRRRRSPARSRWRSADPACAPRRESPLDRADVGERRRHHHRHSPRTGSASAASRTRARLPRSSDFCRTSSTTPTTVTSFARIGCRIAGRELHADRIAAGQVPLGERPVDDRVRWACRARPPVRSRGPASIFVPIAAKSPG